MFEIRNPKHEIRNKSQIPMIKIRNDRGNGQLESSRDAGQVLNILGLGLWICFGFRISRFGFGCGFAALSG
jgi:hypothetical protein